MSTREAPLFYLRSRQRCVRRQSALFPPSVCVLIELNDVPAVLQTRDSRGIYLPNYIEPVSHIAVDVSCLHSAPSFSASFVVYAMCRTDEVLLLRSEDPWQK